MPTYKGKHYDYAGWATRSNVKCYDGLTIMPDAFADQDDTTVPLVWMHNSNTPFNILGQALLHNVNDASGSGVKAYLNFNDTDSGKQASELVRHGDIFALSIYANGLKKQGSYVKHGIIREVSLVTAGANPEARIEYPFLSHGVSKDDAEEVIFYGVKGDMIEDEDDDDYIEHAATGNEDGDGDEGDSKVADNKGKTVKDVYSSMSQEKKAAIAYLADQAKNGADPKELKGDDADAARAIIKDFSEDEMKVCNYVIGLALQNQNGNDDDEDDDEDEEEDDEEEGEKASMKHNAFENDMSYTATLTPEKMDEIKRVWQNTNSLRSAFNQVMGDDYLSHAIYEDDDVNHEHEVTYGIANLKYLFPDARKVTDTPIYVKRDTDWVSGFMRETKHTPFSRIKSIFADITMDEARARGYIKGDEKINEVFTLLKRITEPTTVYKFQTFDRDDIIDITDMNVIAWVKAEMRMMLDEEIARAALTGDGRLSASRNHIDESKIRPIWTDDDFFTIKHVVPTGKDDSATAANMIDEAVLARVGYKGQGRPNLYTTETWLTRMLLLKDGLGYRLYKTEAELATAMRVEKIVTVPIMEGLTRAVGGTTHNLMGIIVNPKDYNFGADKGGEVNTFDDFDIKYNQQQYLIETRVSGALVTPYSAIVLETVAGTTPVEPDDHDNP